MSKRTLWNVLVPLLVMAAAHVFLFLPLPLALQPHLVQAVAALVLAGFLPGALLVQALVGQGAAPPNWWERTVYSAGAAYIMLVGGMLALSYLPGGPTRQAVLILFDVLTLALIAWVAWRGRTAPADAAVWPLVADRRWLLAGVLVLLLVGGVLRLGHLGYTDFQGDEARATLRAAATIQGYEDVLFLHKKGPTEILLPTALYALTGHLTEATARLPFALANLAALFAIWLLGWRLFNPLGGLGRRHVLCTGRLLHRLCPHRPIPERRPLDGGPGGVDLVSAGAPAAGVDRLLDVGGAAARDRLAVTL